LSPCVELKFATYRRTAKEKNMLGTFILGLAAGWGAPFAEPKVSAALGKILRGGSEVGPVELRMITFAACLLGAAILSMILTYPHAFPLAFGAAVGVLVPRLREIWKIARAPDYDS
jgi:drug/metabolite transporter (DMT)-like permease